MSAEDKEDIQVPVSQIDTQLKRESPKMNLINGSITALNGLMTGITANAVGQPILDQLAVLASLF